MMRTLVRLFIEFHGLVIERAGHLVQYLDRWWSHMGQAYPVTFAISVQNGILLYWSSSTSLFLNCVSFPLFILAFLNISIFI